MNQPDLEPEKVNQFMLDFWAWLQRNYYKIEDIDEIPMVIHSPTGTLGRKSLGHYSFSPDKFNPDFLAYLNSPKWARALKAKLESLKETDLLLYTYILLRTRGLTHKEIDRMRAFNFRLSRENFSFSTKMGKNMNVWAIGELLSAIPETYRSKFDPRISEYIINQLEHRKGSIELGIVEFSIKRGVIAKPPEYVDCPRCNGVDPNCKLCSDPDLFNPDWKWTGKVKRTLAKRYLKRISDGKKWMTSNGEEID